VRDWYEDLWEQLPAGAEGPDLDLRWAFLLANAGAGERVLDLGCGAGTLTAALAQAGAQPIGVDVAQRALDRAGAAHPELDLRLAPIDGPLPLADGEVAAVWASEVIEHVADTAHWLSEVRRVLVPGGTLLLTTPNHDRLRAAAIALTRFEAHFDPLSDHLRFYTARSLRTTLATFGFEQIEIRRAGGPPLARRLLLARARRARWVGSPEATG
jgi:SAM-dependent methyltransferase